VGRHFFGVDPQTQLSLLAVTYISPLDPPTRLHSRRLQLLDTLLKICLLEPQLTQNIA